MAVLFTLGLVAYYFLFLRKKHVATSELARLLWWMYFGLGCSAIIISVTGVRKPLFDPNYPAIFFLLFCIAIGISGFVRFRAHDVREVVSTVRGQKLIEAVLIGFQVFSIAFFLPFAVSSLQGDTGMNRLELSNRLEVLGSYGLTNTIAGMGAHLFVASLVMAFIRLCQPKGSGYSLPRAMLLVLASLSYVIYVLAYVGRDGSIYWLMTVLLLFIIFRLHISAKVRRQIIVIGASLGALVLLPMIAITIGRFASSDTGLGGGIWDYYGLQIINFSDYSRLERPMTYGAMNFPLLWQPYCSVLGGAGCETWDVIKDDTFAQYLAQGMAPWLFGTYVSDFLADFGYAGVTVLLTTFAILCHRVCVGRDALGRLSLPRLLLIILFFLTPYWGVFYFRFMILNSFLLGNFSFIVFVWFVQRLTMIKAVPTAPLTNKGHWSGRPI